MGILKTGFKKAGGILGEAILAVVGIGTVYGLGWVSGLKQGSKLEERLSEALDNLDETDETDTTEEETTEEIIMTETPEEDSENQQED